MTPTDQSCVKLHYTYILLGGLCSGRREIPEKDKCGDTYFITGSHSLMHSTCFFPEENTDAARLSNPEYEILYRGEHCSNCLILMKEKHPNKQ